MGKFLTGNLQIEEDDLTGMKKLLKDVVYLDGETVYTVPKGYETDYASIPRALAWIYPKDARYRKAAVLHDWLITNGLDKKEFEIESNRVDELFREAMDAIGGVPKIRQWIMWAGVRLGAIGNKKRRKGSWRTLPKVLGIIALSSPVLLPPSLVVQAMITLLWIITLPLPKIGRAHV